MIGCLFSSKIPHAYLHGKIGRIMKNPELNLKNVSFKNHME